MNEPTDYDYHKNKRNDRVYLSRVIENKDFVTDVSGFVKEIIRPLRIISKVIDVPEDHEFIRDGKEISLRVSAGGRVEIKAKFYEDTRGITTLTIQKYTADKPNPTHFTFVGSDIVKLYNFIRNIPLIPISQREGAKFEDHFVSDIVLSKQNVIKIIHEHPELIREIMDNDVTHKDIVNLNYRKKQLIRFDKLLNDDGYFASERQDKRGDEAVWQRFFEENKWIFGYGLNFVFNSTLENSKLEQVVSGHTKFESGKRVDALLKTKGLISSLCFCEIKTHKTALLKRVKEPYRGESWGISDEFAGAIAQIHRTVQKSVENIRTKTEIKNQQGDLTGEQVFLYQPRSFVVIGTLKEFVLENGINEDKFSSFELYRQNSYRPEVITFDELYERAKFIVDSEAYDKLAD
jgi:hypothetical protein